MRNVEWISSPGSGVYDNTGHQPKIVWTHVCEQSTSPTHRIRCGSKLFTEGNMDATAAIGIHNVTTEWWQEHFSFFSLPPLLLFATLVPSISLFDHARPRLLQHRTVTSVAFQSHSFKFKFERFQVAKRQMCIRIMTTCELGLGLIWKTNIQKIKLFVLFRVSSSDISDILDNKKVISISINKTWQKDSTSQSVVTVIRSGCLLDSYRNETSDVSCCTWGKLVCVDLRV